MSDNGSGRWEFDEEGNVHYVEAQEPQHSHNKKKDTGWHWVLIVLAFAVAWPVGLILLFLELSGRWPGNREVGRQVRRAASAAKQAAQQYSTTAQQPYNTTAQRQTTAAYGTGTSAASNGTKKNRRQDEGKAYGLGNVRKLRIIGGLMTGIFGFAFVMELIDELTYFFSIGWLLEETVPLLALTLIGVTLLGVAGSRQRKLKKFRRYLKMIGNRDEVSVSSLAGAMGTSEKKVFQDLEEMLERDFFETGYLDVARQKLVLREGGVADMPEPEPQAEETPELQNYNTLRRIRQINDAIPNPELSEKIYRIEELTAKIFRLLEERPEKAGELRSFMNYYLPQTLKILESYAKLEAQGVDGGNIQEAKQKIESMMDKLVDGYETQLDKLFADDVLDISADLKVMEQMLEKDGLTVDNGLNL
jgi:hypothetical protein